MDNKVSFIVPVYNVEKYLKRCVDTILNQTYKNIEVILVDDKARDSSGALCDKIAKEDARVTTIHKEINEGLGYARNTGLEATTGDFIVFVDSDDYIDLTLCEKCVNKLNGTGADACYYGQKKDICGRIKEYSFSGLKEEYVGESIVNDFLTNTLAQDVDQTGAPTIGMAAWKMMYRAEVIKNNNLKFVSERDWLNEDLFFRVELVKHIKKIAIVPENLYYYCYNDASLTTSYRPDRFDASKRMYKKLVEDTKEFNSSEIENRCRRAFMNNLMVCLRQEVRFEKKNTGSYKDRIKSICSDDCVQTVLLEYPVDAMAFQSKLFFSAIKHSYIGLIVLLIKLKG